MCAGLYPIRIRCLQSVEREKSMLTKFLLGLIASAAFCYALFLLLRGRRPVLPQQPPRGNFRARIAFLFLLATILCYGCFDVSSDKRSDITLCYSPMEPPTSGIPQESLLRSLRLAWQTFNTQSTLIDNERTDKGLHEAIANFQEQARQASAKGILSPAVAEGLIRLHTQLARHHDMITSMVLCYRPLALPDKWVSNTEQISMLYDQLEMLREARVKQTISHESFVKVELSIRGNIETLLRIAKIESGDEDINKQKEPMAKLYDELKETRLSATELGKDLTGAVLLLEGVPSSITDVGAVPSSTLRISEPDAAAEIDDPDSSGKPDGGNPAADGAAKNP